MISCSLRSFRWTRIVLANYHHQGPSNCPVTLRVPHALDLVGSTVMDDLVRFVNGLTVGNIEPPGRLPFKCQIHHCLITRAGWVHPASNAGVGAGEGFNWAAGAVHAGGRDLNRAEV